MLRSRGAQVESKDKKTHTLGILAIFFLTNICILQDNRRLASTLGTHTKNERSDLYALRPQQ